MSVAELARELARSEDPMESVGIEPRSTVRAGLVQGAGEAAALELAVGFEPEGGSVRAVRRPCGWPRCRAGEANCRLRARPHE